MSDQQRHIIRHQVLEFNLPSSTGSNQLQRKMSILFQEQVLPELEKVFDELTSEGQTLRVKELEVDLGPLSDSELEEAFLETCVRRIREEVGLRLRRAELRPEAANYLVSRSTTVIESFHHFLATGRLPWRAPVEALRDLETAVILAYEEKKDGSDPTLRRLLREEAPVPQRLVRQFSDQLLKVLIQHLVPPGTSEMIIALNGLAGRTVEQLSGFSASAQQLKRDLWLAIFHHLTTSGSSPDRSRQLLSAILDEWSASFPRTEEWDRVLNSWSEQYASGKIPVTAPDFLSKAEWVDLIEAMRRPDATDMVQAAASKERITRSVSTQEHDDAKSDDTDLDPGPATEPDRVGEKKDEEIAPEQTSKETSFAQKDKPDVSKRNVPEDAEEEKKEEMQEKRLKRKAGESSSRAPVKKDETKTPAVPPAGPPAERPRQSGPSYRGGSKEEPIFVENAGLSLIVPFLPRFFDALGLLSEGKFPDEIQQERAAHILHYLAYFNDRPPEYELLLNKLLCGIPLERPLERDILITEAEKEECRQLLEAVLRNWGALGGTRPEGLQQAYLQRKGKLLFQEGSRSWVLQVEKKSVFDLLLNKLPWGFSVLKMKWMPEMLRVEWGVDY